MRFNQMRRYLKHATDKTLSCMLKELEADNLVARTAHPEVPPRVEYTLAERSRSLVAVLDKLCDWSIENRR